MDAKRRGQKYKSKQDLKGQIRINKRKTQQWIYCKFKGKLIRLSPNALGGLCEFNKLTVSKDQIEKLKKK